MITLDSRTIILGIAPFTALVVMWGYHSKGNEGLMLRFILKDRKGT